MYQSGTPSPQISRQERLARAISSAGIKALALNPSPTLVYLTGLHFHLMERPVVVTFVPGEAPVIVMPELEVGKVVDLPYHVRYYTYGEDPGTWGDVFRQAMTEAKLDPNGIIGVETTLMRVLELQLMQNALPDAKFVSANQLIANLRMIKDPAEIAAMRKAVEIAQNALLAILPVIQIGMTEKELAAELTLQLLRGGSDSQLPFPPIVSAGPNSANPHAVPTDRPLQAGDLLVIDWGAIFDSYCSDLTRTFAVGDIEPEYAHIAQIVLEANLAGRQAAGPEVSAGEVDAAARLVIESAGYGPFFTHRTGHGLGMEGHEEPYIRGGSSQFLATGMTFTVEPGIYLPGRGGVRIEDDVVITAIGAESLSDLPRQLIRVG
jgi:Xaa-Pro dipeptidase